VSTRHEMVISKEDAVFWMDGNGRWCNADGRFRHKKIIDHFHAAIEKDDKGYFLCQERGNVIEKVYFRYEETALFVFEVIIGGEIELVLNTGLRVSLDPERLCVKDDALFMCHGDEVIKFSDRSMMKIGRFIDEDKGRLYFCRNGKRYIIRAHP